MFVPHKMMGVTYSSAALLKVNTAFLEVEWYKYA